MSGKQYKVRMPLFPEYSRLTQLLKAFSGLERANVVHLINSIRDQTGTPQNPVDWSDPDTWISEKLKGSDADIASQIWNDSKQTINPRYLYGSYLFINGYE